MQTQPILLAFDRVKENKTNVTYTERGGWKWAGNIYPKKDTLPSPYPDTIYVTISLDPPK